MLDVELNDLVFFAQDAAAPGGPSPLAPLVTMVLPLVILYFFMIHRPMKREQAAREAMIRNVKKNDRVLTTGGIYGVVTNVQSDANEVTIRVDDSSNTKLRMTIQSIARILGDESGDAKEG